MTDKTILLADDEEGIRKVLGISLADLGYEVLTAENGWEALHIFRKNRPFLVLTDIKMPVMDGIELLRQIKKESPDTEVIIITGHGELELAIQSIKSDAADFITKPINDSVLEIAIKRAVERTDMRQQLNEYMHNLEKMVQEKTEKLIQAERLAAVGETVTGLSHAIKNIAGGLKGGGFILEKGIELENRNYLLQGWEMVKGNVDKIAKLSLDLLSYAKTTEIKPLLCDPNEPALEVAELMKNRADTLGIDIRTDFAQDAEMFYFDPELIHSCLLNLVTNAIESFEEQGSVKNRVVLRTRVPGGWGVEYQVWDNGCGMVPETREKVFQAFHTTKGSKGTGIGLMISKKIVDGHMGQIEFKSEQGKGSEFIIRLPR
ncbi:MAG: response regulator [Desulfobacteraceae bacterium]|nr:response regulator [Desulfobacteraceae bacterium]